MAKRIFPVIHVDETTPHLHCDGAVDQAGNLSAKDVIVTKEMRRTQEKFLKQCKKAVPAPNLKCHSTINGFQTRSFTKR